MAGYAHRIRLVAGGRHRYADRTESGRGFVQRPSRGGIRVRYPCPFGRYRGGSVIITGPEPITWLEVPEATEALEIYPEDGLPGWDSAALVRDGTVLAIASVLRHVHAAGADISDIAASTLAHRLAEHLGAGRPPEWRPRRGVDRKCADSVVEFIDANLAGRITLDQLAAVAMLSPYHFAHSFRKAMGLAPHQFVTSRRVDRATHLLRTSSASVADIACAVGMPNVSHFRRVFLRYTGWLPGQLRL